MNITEYQTMQLILNPPTFNKLSFTLLINRMRRTYTSNPCEEVLSQCTEEINQFLQKYYLAMAPDYAYLQKNYKAYEEYHLAA